MLDNKVVTHASFKIDATTRAQIEAAGASLDFGLTAGQIAEMKLKEPEYGELIVGECTNEEAAIFHALYGLRTEIEDETRTLMGQSIASLGTSIRDSDRNKPMHELLESGQVKIDFLEDADAEKYFALQQHANYMHAAFHWIVGERLGKHSQRLGVRSKLRIVVVEARY